MKITSKQIKQLIEQQLAAVLEQDLPQVASRVPVQGTVGRTDRPRFEGEEFMTPLEVDQAIRGRIPELDQVSVDFANPPPERSTMAGFDAFDSQSRSETEDRPTYASADPAEEELYFSQSESTRNPEDTP
tara:strand:+ start:1306 stop:1695 length:390 start_codon:yes stop_codon:yes gene_type:complete